MQARKHTGRAVKHAGIKDTPESGDNPESGVVDELNGCARRQVWLCAKGWRVAERRAVDGVANNRRDERPTQRRTEDCADARAHAGRNGVAAVLRLEIGAIGSAAIRYPPTPAWLDPREPPEPRCRS
jgi:hypothetical protein